MWRYHLGPEPTHGTRSNVGVSGADASLSEGVVRGIGAVIVATSGSGRGGGCREGGEQLLSDSGRRSD